MALMEAMAAGLPVVASRVGGIPELVAERETGILVEPNAEQSLIQALQSLTANAALRLQMGQAARQRASERFDIRQTVRQYEALYEERLADKSLSRL